MKFREMVERELYENMIEEVRDYLVSILDNQIRKSEEGMALENESYTVYAKRFRRLWELKAELKVLKPYEFLDYDIKEFLYHQDIFVVSMMSHEIRSSIEDIRAIIKKHIILSLPQDNKPKNPKPIKPELKPKP